MWPAPDAPLQPFLLAHHRVSGRHRCFRLQVGQRPVFLCARCSGIAVGFTLGAAALLSGAFQLSDAATALWLLPLPAFLDWARGQRDPFAGNNALRAATGGLLGLWQALAYASLLLRPTEANLWLATVAYGGCVVIAKRRFVADFARRLLREAPWTRNPSSRAGD